jgi:hypothetical protein
MMVDCSSRAHDVLQQMKNTVPLRSRISHAQPRPSPLITPEGKGRDNERGRLPGYPSAGNTRSIASGEVSEPRPDAKSAINPCFFLEQFHVYLVETLTGDIPP